MPLVVPFAFAPWARLSGAPRARVHDDGACAVTTSGALEMAMGRYAAGDDAAVRTELVALRAMLDVLGLDPADPQWSTSSDDRHAAALDALVTAELAARAQARAAKDWATSDAIRDRLAAAGIEVQDSADGARWALS